MLQIKKKNVRKMIPLFFLGILLIGTSIVSGIATNEETEEPEDTKIMHKRCHIFKHHGNVVEEND